MIFEIYYDSVENGYICRNNLTINSSMGVSLQEAITQYLSGKTYTISADGGYMEYFNNTKSLFTASSLEDAKTKYPEYFI